LTATEGVDYDGAVEPTILLEQCALVVVGSWNQAIFTPQWVSERVFDSEVKVEITFAPGLLMRIRTDSAELMLVGERLQLRPLRDDPDAFEVVRKAANRVLECLPETPVRALGLNYVFEQGTVSPALAALAAAVRQSGLPDAADVAVQLRMSVPTLGGATVNIRMDVEKERAEVELNFHTAVETVFAAFEALRKQPHAMLLGEASRWATRMLRQDGGPPGVVE